MHSLGTFLGETRRESRLVPSCLEIFETVKVSNGLELQLTNLELFSNCLEIHFLSLNNVSNWVKIDYNFLELS